jgi:hypothetical protein
MGPLGQQSGTDWFDKGIKRKNELNKFCVFCDDIVNRLIQVFTHWLSLERPVSRTLEMYQSLKRFFLAGSKKQPRLKRLTVLQNRHTVSSISVGRGDSPSRPPAITLGHHLKTLDSSVYM